MLSALGQSHLIYHIKGGSSIVLTSSNFCPVDSNDTLFGGHERYIEELAVLMEVVVDEIYALLQDNKSRENVLDFMNLVLRNVEMNRQSGTVVVKLFRLQRKQVAESKTNSSPADAYEKRSLNYLGNLKGKWYEGIMDKLV